VKIEVRNLWKIIIEGGQVHSLVYIKKTDKGLLLTDKP